MAMQMRKFELTKILLHVGAVADRKDFYNAVVHDERCDVVRGFLHVESHMEMSLQ